MPVVAEIYHFQHERVIDFREMMKNFLDEQLNFYKEVHILFILDFLCAVELSDMVFTSKLLPWGVDYTFPQRVSLKTS